MSLVKNRNVVIIVSDSRGRGLIEFSQKDEYRNYIHIIRILPGKRFDQVAEIAKDLISQNADNYYCVLLAGICSLTELSTVNGIRQLTYPLQNRDHKVAQLTEQIQDLKFQFGNRINICTIVPALLAKYSAVTSANLQQESTDSNSKEIQQQQEALIDDIQQINEIILKLNSEYNNINISLCRRFFVYSKKKQRKTNSGASRRVSKLNAEALVDGVHFSDKIKTTCFSLIYTAIKRDLDKSDTLSQDSLSESDQDWDFKRKVSYESCSTPPKK